MVLLGFSFGFPLISPVFNWVSHSDWLAVDFNSIGHSGSSPQRHAPRPKKRGSFLQAPSTVVLRCSIFVIIHTDSYLHLPTYVKLSPFRELLLSTFFSACEPVLHFSAFACVCRFWHGKKNQRNSEKDPTKRRTQNVKTETAKKNGNGDFLGNRRQLLLFRISSDNFA